MATANGATLVRRIRKLALTCSSQQSDVELLQQFLADRDEAAFAALVQRHGGMVLGLCRSVLRHQQDAEDVFQATFLVLARKAYAIRKQQSLGSWLHGVAYRLAMKARGQARRHRVQPLIEDAPTSSNAVDDLTVRELRAILHDEFHRLPEKYRGPLLLCYWEGKTRDEAAEALGMTPGAFKKRLERARGLLGSRLVSRGLAPSAALFATLLTSEAKAALSKTLIHSTAQAASAFASGAGSAAGAPAAAVALAEGVLRTMNLTKLVASVITIFLVGVLSLGLALIGYQFLRAEAPGTNRFAAGNAQQNKQEGKPKEGKKLTDEERILGTWKFIKGRRNGEDAPAEFGAASRITFEKDGKVIVTILDVAKVSKYKIAAPGVIDLSMNPNDTELSPGIFKFDDEDHFRLCINDGDPKRPEKFSAEKGEPFTLFHLERSKKLTKEEIAKLKLPVGKFREAAQRSVSTNNLKQIGIAFLNHHQAYKSYPAQALYSKDGKTPLLSWRVAILPFVGHLELYKEFKLDEPWDSEHNKKLIAKMPAVYGPLDPADRNAKDKGLTHYQVVAGRDTLFDGPKKMRFMDIKDGAPNTLMAIEAAKPVVWTKPADLQLPEDKEKLPALGGLFSNGAHALYCDGLVRILPTNVRPEVFRAIVTPAGGEKVELEK